MQISNINPDTITDLAGCQIVIQLLNVIEALAAENAALWGEIQNLRDENARLKERSAKPDIKPPTPPSAPPVDHSSKAERQIHMPHGKPKKNETLIVTHEERCLVDPTTLPPDAMRHGTQGTIVQRLHLAAEVVRFVREVWYVPSTNTIPIFPSTIMPGNWQCDARCANVISVLVPNHEREHEPETPSKPWRPQRPNSLWGSFTTSVTVSSRPQPRPRSLSD